MGAWEENVRKVTPYTPGEQPKRQDIIKLNTNENPYPPAPGVGRILERFDPEELRLYPDPAACTLKEALAETYRVKTEQIFVGVGSDDVLAMYPVWAEEFRIPYEVCPLDERFRIVKEDYYGENGGVVFPNPNAPTGLFMGLEDVEDIIRHNQDAVVIVDEAYVDFGAESAMPLTEKYENLLVVQTFSKSRSMAGMRIGFAVGSPKLIRYLEDVKYSFNSYTMSRLALRCGAEAVRDRAYFEETTARIRETRERAKKILGEMGFVCTDSMANFLFAAHPEHRAADLFQALKEAGIYVRYFAKPRIDDYLRITVGTDQQMEVLYGFLRNYLSHRGK